MASSNPTADSGTFAGSAISTRPTFSAVDIWTALSAYLAQRAAARRAGRIAAFIEANGGDLTDDLERTISRRFGSVVEGP